MDPIQCLAIPRRDPEVMRDDLYAHFARDTVARRRDIIATAKGLRIPRLRRRTRTAALAR